MYALHVYYCFDYYTISFVLCIVWHSRGSNMSPFHFYCFKQCVKTSYKVQFTYEHIIISQHKVWTTTTIHKGDTGIHSLAERKVNNLYFVAVHILALRTLPSH